MILDEFKQIVESRHEYAKNWKSKTGGKVCGCICANVPEEYIYAAGILPVRVLPEPKDAETNAAEHIQANKCAMCRGALEQALRGSYDYVDALVYVQGCLAQSQAFDSWVLHKPLLWSYKMFQPFRQDIPEAEVLYKDLFDDFRSSFEKWLGKPVSKEALAESVAVYRENRQLLKQVYELRKKSPPLFSGVDAEYIVMSSLVMDKKEHNELLKKLLQELQAKQPSGNGDRTRIMVIGSGVPPVDFIEIVESAGADVVIEDHCIGSRYFYGEDPDDPPKNADPLEAIIRYYHDKKVQCIYQDWDGKKFRKRVTELFKDFKADAVIWLEQVFCGTHQWEIPEDISMFEQMGVPILRIQRGRTIPKGRMLPEVEAFLAKVKGK
ncbi:MAG: 2-hydroxyacyl-CoA dehydratase family protein [Dehalococcoidia bacterium]